METKNNSETETKTENNKLNEKNQQLINVLKRQTNYDENTILEKMNLFNNNIEKIILDYHNVDLEQKKKEQEDNMTSNQKIFKSIRTFF